MRRITWVFVLAMIVGLVPAMADTTWSFSYVGVTNATINGSGTFTTGTDYGDGYLAITSIAGTTELGAILGLEVSAGAGIDPAVGHLECCQSIPGWDFTYDNAFSPSGANPFSSTGGLLFDVGLGTFPISPVEIYSTGNPGTFEISYGRDTPNGNPPAYGGNEITFTATQQVPDGGTTLSLLGLALVGMAGLRRKLSL